MRAPALNGRIDRRICLHYLIDPAVARQLLPGHLRPRLYQGSALGGICVFRMAPLRPRLLPIPLGFGAEIAWHRIAVEWMRAGKLVHGQYLLRCEADSGPGARMTHRVTSAPDTAARITVRSNNAGLLVDMKSTDGLGDLRLAATPGAGWPEASVFPSAQAAQLAFAGGHVLWTGDGEQEIDGFEFSFAGGSACTLSTREVQSAWFDDGARFPLGSIQFDSALLVSRSDQKVQTESDGMRASRFSAQSGEVLPA